MKNSNYFFAVMFLIITSTTFAQSETKDSIAQKFFLEGRVTDQTSGEPILFGSVVLYSQDKVIAGSETDIEGNYRFTVTQAGPFDIEMSYVGYQPTRISDIILKSGKINKVDITISEGFILNTATIVAYSEPLMKFDKTTSASTVTSSQIRNFPTKSISALSARVAGISIGRKGRKNAKHQEQINYNTEDYDFIEENKFQNTDDQALSTFSIDVDRASYSNVRRFINQQQLPPKDAVRVEEMINYFDYNYAAPENRVPFNIEHTLTSCPWNKKNQILHIGVQGKEIKKEDLPPSNLVFLIDVSGSMSSYNKLELVKSSLKMLVDNLREEDRIALVVYAGSAGLVLKSTSGIDKKKIKKAISRLNAGGSTAGGAGIQLAYKIAKENFIAQGNNRVILATDGDFNVGVSSDGSLVDMISKKRKENIFLSILGYGMGNYKDNKMQKLADSGNGNHAYIDNIDEAKKTLINEFGGTLFTIAKDVKIQIEFNPEFVKSYKLIGYENRMLENRDFNDDKKDAGELGAGHSVTAIYEIVPANSKKEMASVDKLKYQTQQSVNNQSDFATIKMRYKKPIGNKSKIIEQIISPKLNEFVKPDIQFALSVAEFGLLLRESEYCKKGSYQSVLESANENIGLDEHGYRAEFISMVENVILLEKEN